MSRKLFQALGALGLSLVMTLSLVPPAFAAGGSWRGGDGAWWYAYDGGGYARGWDYINGSWYHFNRSGWMQTGWLRTGGTWYYLWGSGAMAEGWANVGGTWYYLYPGSGAMATGWVNDRGTWYFMNNSGAMRTGWLYRGGVWYYLWGSGAMAEGWGNVGGTWYYFRPGSGAMVVGWQWINGEYYYFEPSGAMVANRWIGNYYVGPSGAMLRSQWVGRYYVGADGAWIPNYVEVAKPIDPTRPGVVQTPTHKSKFTYAVGNYVLAQNGMLSEVKSGSPTWPYGSLEWLAGDGFQFGDGVGDVFASGYACGYGVYITGYNGVTGESVVIPDSIDGIPVVFANLTSSSTAPNADPRLVMPQVDATQAKHLQWLSVGGAPRELYCQGASQLAYLSVPESSLLSSFDGSTLGNLEVFNFGKLPREFSVSKQSLVTFSATYQSTDGAIPYINLANAPYLQSFSINHRGASLAAGPLTSNGFSIAGCQSLVTVALPFQSITSFNPNQFPNLQELELTNNPLDASSKAACEAWGEESGHQLSLTFP